jgi:hypothetical protein
MTPITSCLKHISVVQAHVTYREYLLSTYADGRNEIARLFEAGYFIVYHGGLGRN